MLIIPSVIVGKSKVKPAKGYPIISTSSPVLGLTKFFPSIENSFEKGFSNSKIAKSYLLETSYTLALLAFPTPFLTAIFFAL